MSRMASRSFRPALLFAVLLALGAGLRGQAPSAGQPQFRSGVDLVSVDVTVLGRGGNPVLELTPADFSLTVDGKPRAIQSVRLVRSAATAPAPEATGGDVRPDATKVPAPAVPVVDAPRYFVIVIDRDYIPVGEGQSMLAAAAKFVDGLAPSDRVAVWTSAVGGQTLRFGVDREAPKQQIRSAVGTHRPTLARWMVGRDEAIRAVDGEQTPDGPMIGVIIARECERQPPSCPPEVRAQVQEVALEAQTHAERFLATMESLIGALGTIDAPKHLVLVTPGPVMTQENMRQVSSLGAVAARARVTVHTIQVRDAMMARTDQMRASPEQVDQMKSVSFNLATTTGGLAMTPASGEIGFTRLARELSATYLLAFETQPGDRDNKVHQIDVKVRDRGWGTNVRFRKSFRIDPNAPVPANPAPAAPPAATAAPVVPAEPVGVEPGDMADRLARYSELFESEFSAVVAEERFVQTIHPWHGEPAGPDKEPALNWLEPGAKESKGAIIARRQLLSDVLMVQLKGRQWQSYRDVGEVDGNPVRDRADRVQRLFLSGGPDLAGRFQEIALESARYNLGDIKRDLNLPTVTLSLLRRVNHPRFEFKRQKDVAIDGASCRVLAYKEKVTPTLISTRNSGDVFLYGRIWLDAADGKVRRTELRYDRTGGGRSYIRVDYGPAEGYGIFLPVHMWEWYEGANLEGRIGGDMTVAEGLATYSKYRRFKVSTTETISK
jgi:VWFA-related protein